MNIGFIVERNIYFKSFSPVIDALLKRGHQVFCLHNYGQPKTGSKGYQFPAINQTPKFQNGQVASLEFKTEDEFIEKILQNNVQVVISLDFIASYIPIKNKLKEKNVFWVSLQSSFDIGPSSGEYLKEPDKLFAFSTEWLLGVFKYLCEIKKNQEKSFFDFEQNLQENIKKVGFWAADTPNLFNKEAIRKEWAIPPEKKVVLLFPFPFGSSFKKPWAKYIYGMHNRFLQLPIVFLLRNKRFFQQVIRKENDYEAMKAIRKFCDANNGFLLIKSRQKDPVKKYAAKMADKVLYDQEFYPSTVLKCFAVADIF
ncbi:MAG: hypothetical protein PHE77_03135, partial [Candidatus Pacebacteria bacterium]|nr:hypothetical protein [Candidatus Paceibacterota bacterium]